MHNLLANKKPRPFDRDEAKTPRYHPGSARNRLHSLRRNHTSARITVGETGADY